MTAQPLTATPETKMAEFSNSPVGESARSQKANGYKLDLDDDEFERYEDAV